MKHVLTMALLIMTVGFTTQCQPPKPGESAGGDPVENMNGSQAADSALYVVLETPKGALSLHDSLMIRFTVVNPTTDTLKFTAYHTPFEGVISKFLAVTDSAGNEVDYLGPMVKRVMPPPADTYHSLPPGQRQSSLFDLKKGYRIEKAGTYTLQYIGGQISGIAGGEPITITVAEDRF